MEIVFVRDSAVNILKQIIPMVHINTLDALFNSRKNKPQDLDSQDEHAHCKKQL